MTQFDLRLGDCHERLKEIAADSIDSIVTDPPYELAFMGKGWDQTGIAYDRAVWRECLRVLKPGGHLLAFGGSRTYHRLASAIEDAGFEIRDQIMWMYGSGFPKSLDVSKAIDKQAGKDRQVVGHRKHPTLVDTEHKLEESANAAHGGNTWAREWDITAPATNAAKQWQGWGTALKPAHEPIVLARKPLIGTVAANVLKHGTGGINIDACRVEHVTVADGNLALNPHLRTHINGGNGGRIIAHEEERRVVVPNVQGRWPANVIHDGSEEVVSQFPQSKGQQGDVKGSEPSATGDNGIYGHFERVAAAPKRGDDGSAARFFKTIEQEGTEVAENVTTTESPLPPVQNSSASDYAESKGRTGEESALTRYTEEGSTNFAPLPGIRRERADSPARFFYCAKAAKKDRGVGNTHPTVKPTQLMRYLCRLITPPGGTILDPFTGSGSTGKAALLEGFRFIGIEQEAAYVEIARGRLLDATAEYALAV